MSPLDERDYIRYDLGPLLRRNGFTKDKLKIFVMDDIVSLAPFWSSFVLGEREAAAYVSGLAFTWHWNHVTSSRLILDLMHERWPQHYLLSSEATSGLNSKGKELSRSKTK